jgi:peptide chain release factor 2
VTQEIRRRLEEVSALIESIKEASRYDSEKLRLGELEEQMSAQDFWEDSEKAEGVIQELKRVKETVTSVDEVTSRLEDARTLLSLGEEESDADTITEAESESRQLLRAVEKLELRALLSGNYDSGNAYITIQSGAGGTDACDWVTILKRMFIRWAERMGYKVSVIDELPGEEAGLKSFSAHIAGPYAYGYLRAEHGVHRLVRISPFDAQGRRQTSFASLDVSPEVEEAEISIDESDLRIDTYRASGAGGQHVNTTDSAVRITHIPTGVVVQCQNQRSQHANRTQALKVLQSRLVQLEEKRREEEIARETGAKREIAFGSQIRSYVLHPYKQVKDHRTKHETGNIDAVLDGELQDFIETFLRQKAETTSE